MQKVSIVLPTKNEEKNIGPLLQSIFGQEYDGEIQVFIMDSSDDRTVEIAGTFPVETVRVETEDYNYGKCRNDGAAATDGDYLVFISADVEISNKQWLSSLVGHFSDPDVAGVYGRQLPKATASPIEQFFILHTYRAQSRVASLETGNRNSGMVVFSNTNSAIRRSVWQDIRIPEMLKSEDQEWAKRALLAGYKIVYDAKAAVNHSNKYTLKSVFHEYFDSGAVMPAVYGDGVFDYSMRHFVVDGVKYVISEYKFLVTNGYLRWLPYAVVCDIAKFLGIVLGSKQKYMTSWMRKALAKKKNHWDKYPDVIKRPA